MQKKLDVPWDSTRTIIALTLMLIFSGPSQSLATERGNGRDDDGCRGNCSGGGQNGHPVTTTVVVGQRGGESHSNASSISESSSVSSAQARSGSSSVSGSISSSGGNSQNLEINNVQPDDITIRNVASPDTPNPYPTAPCRVGLSGGLSLPGGALSGGGSVEDEECTLRETARSFKDLGVPEMGLYLLCTQSEVVSGKRDKKGRLKKGEPEPVGVTECLRLVREFQGDNSDVVVGYDDSALVKELEILRAEVREFREGQSQLESELNRVDQRSSAHERAAREVTRQVIQQDYLDEGKKQKLASLLSDAEEQKK